MGAAGVPTLIRLIEHSPSDHARWEAAKALGQIGDPSGAAALVEALEDNDGGTRWLAAEGLIGLGEGGLSPLLQALVEHSDSVWLREGGHVVCRALSKGPLAGLLSPLSAALEGAEPELVVPLAAGAARMRLCFGDTLRLK